ncbi:hypothetical protein NDU88_003159 [Pleurodeles waltl]|uniref:Uncharacterized protein n=1 Tax=Pleurodeles waltl TaxID=8319 RepID=A0AAV7WS91_PLEWA|nr:hypothetical protein NDU88_003159 [Pleurodeles waltl]
MHQSLHSGHLPLGCTHGSACAADAPGVRQPNLRYHPRFLPLLSGVTLHRPLAVVSPASGVSSAPPRCHSAHPPPSGARAAPSTPRAADSRAPSPVSRVSPASTAGVSSSSQRRPLRAWPGPLR